MSEKLYFGFADTTNAGSFSEAPFLSIEDELNFNDSYLNLLILQYRQKPKAEATINAHVQIYRDLYNIISRFERAFDVDFAVGVQLNIIGKIVGLSRNIPYSQPLNYFGFSENANSKTFGEGSFYNVDDPLFTATILSDEDYRFYLRAKIAKNVVSAKMIDDDLSIQDAISFMFGVDAYITDNQDMTMTLYIDENYPTQFLNLFNLLDLIPRPQGVGIRYAILLKDKNFSFADNPNGYTFNQGSFVTVQEI